MWHCAIEPIGIFLLEKEKDIDCPALWEGFSAARITHIFQHVIRTLSNVSDNNHLSIMMVHNDDVGLCNACTYACLNVFSMQSIQNNGVEALQPNKEEPALRSVYS